MNKDELLSALDGMNVEYERHQHPPLYTCEDARMHLDGVKGQGTKNLFLRNEKKERYYLVAVCDEKRVDLKGLRAVLSESKLSFGNEEDLKSLLGVAPGAVTLLAAVNDEAKRVEVCVDAELWEKDSFQCHPLENTETLVLSKEALTKFLSESKHPPRVIKVPAVAATPA
jgi:Ala-tRNA(Pro) deacylase